MAKENQIYRDSTLCEVDKAEAVEAALKPQSDRDSSLQKAERTRTYSEQSKRLNFGLLSCPSLDSYSTREFLKWISDKVLYLAKRVSAKWSVTSYLFWSRLILVLAFVKGGTHKPNDWWIWTHGYLCTLLEIHSLIPLMATFVSDTVSTFAPWPVNSLFLLLLIIASNSHVHVCESSTR